MKIGISVIHNFEKKRNDYLFERVNALLLAIDTQFEGIEFKIGYQPSVTLGNSILVKFRDSYQNFLVNSWNEYLGASSSTKFRNRVLSTIYFCKKILSTISLHRRKSSSIELLLTDKHIRAWSSFLNSDAKYLICFEDDVIFKPDSIQRVLDFINYIERNHENTIFYSNLAGGSDHASDQIRHLNIFNVGQYRYFKRAVTNTNCAYLISRPAAEFIYSAIINNPMLRYINADWLLNKAFMDMFNQDVECVCVHPEPTIFIHGSLNGTYNSLVR